MSQNRKRKKKLKNKKHLENILGKHIMSEQEINTQTYITVLIEQRNEALNKLASYMAVTKELEKKVKEIQSSDEANDKQDVE